MGDGPIVEALFTKDVKATLELRERCRDDPLDVAQLAHIRFDSDDIDLGCDLTDFFRTLFSSSTCRATIERPAVAFTRKNAAQSRDRVLARPPVMRTFLPASLLMIQSTKDAKSFLPFP